MQVDDIDWRNNFSTSGAAMELFDFYDYERQRWVITHIVDGYYKIISYVSGLAVTAPVSENMAVTQTAYSDLDTQLWKITSTSTGYMLAPKSNIAYFMVGGNYNGTPESSQVKICSAKANSEDKWILARIGYASDVVPESQLLSEWCWVTAARMFAKHFYPNVTYTQENAVVHVKGKYCDESGDREDAQKAINYYVSNIPNAEIDTVIKENVIYAEDILHEAIQKTRNIIEEKNPNIPDKDEVAKQVGIGAVIFNDLYNQRIKDVIFDWDKLLNFDGETGPYVQYTYARAASVIRKIGEVPAVYDYSVLSDDASMALLKEIARYPQVVADAADKLEPFVVSRYAVALAQAFNKFYHDCQINVDDETVKYTRANVVLIVKAILKDALSLLGIGCPEQM